MLVCDSVDKDRLVVKDQLCNLRKKFYTELLEKEKLIKAAKRKLESQNKLRKVPCVFCSGRLPSDFLSFFSSSEISEHEKTKLKEDYNDLRNDGFHCEEENHPHLFHTLVGPFNKWSCPCRKSFERQDHHIRAADIIDWDSEKDGGYALFVNFGKFFQ